MISAIRSTIIQNTWDHLSKEKVFLAAITAIAIFILYETYKSLKSLEGRIERLNSDNNKAAAAIKAIDERTGKLETVLKKTTELIGSATNSTAQSSNSDTEDSSTEEGKQFNSDFDSTITQKTPERIGKTVNSQKKLVGLERSQTNSQTGQSSSTDIENNYSDDDDLEFFDPSNDNPEEENSGSLRSCGKSTKNLRNNGTSANKSSATRADPIPQFQTPMKSNKETFSYFFPGRNRGLIVQETKKTTLADVFLESLLRFDELESIAQSESVIDCLYILTYKEYKTVDLDLPIGLWKKLPDVISNNVRTALSFQPKIQLSDKLKIRFVAENDGRRIEFNETAVTLSFSSNQAKGHLKSIWISEEEKSEILIEFEHSVPAVPKSASVSSVEFTQLILSLFKK